MANTTDIKQLKAGDHLYEVTYYVVETVREDGNVVVARNTKNNHTICIDSEIVKNAIYTTNQFTEEVKLTRTQLAQKIETLGHSSFRVTFKKQIVSNDVADALANADLSSQAKRRKIVKNLMEGGEKRVMHARLHRTEEFDAAQELGRYRVIDLEALDKNGGNLNASMRLIDTRTCEELVVDNVRYYV